MSSFGALKEDLLRTLTPALTELGFVPMHRSERFVRKAGAGLTHGYQMLVNESPPYARLDIHLFVRIDAVEAIFHRTSGYEKKHQKGTSTMGGALDAITGIPELKMLLDRQQGPSKARTLLFSRRMLGFYDEWYARLSLLEGIDRELNDDPFRETPSRPMPWLRCSTGAIVSRLLERPGFPAVAAAYSQIMQTVSNGFYWPRFEALLRSLDGEPRHAP